MAPSCDLSTQRWSQEKSKATCSCRASSRPGCYKGPCRKETRKVQFFPMGCRWARQPHPRTGPMPRSSWAMQNLLCFLMYVFVLFWYFYLIVCVYLVCFDFHFCFVFERERERRNLKLGRWGGSRRSGKAGIEYCQNVSYWNFFLFSLYLLFFDKKWKKYTNRPGDGSVIKGEAKNNKKYVKYIKIYYSMI